MSYMDELLAAQQAAKAGETAAQKARREANDARKGERADVQALQARIERLKAIKNPSPEQRAALRRLRGQMVGERAEVQTARTTWSSSKDAYKSAASALRTAADALDTYQNYRERAQLLVPWMSGSRRELLDLYAQFWSQYGTPEEALGALRQTDQYDLHFAGNRRADGTLRMDEMTYLGTVASYRDALSEFDILNSWLTSRIPELIENEVSPAEFRDRINTMDERIMSQGDTLRQVYADYYGLEGMTDQALLAAALDPTLRMGLLNRQISIAEIGGAGAESGFQVGFDLSTRMFQAELGLDRATSLFQTAEEMLPGLGRASGRQQEGQFGLEEFIGAEGLGDVASRQQLHRTLQGETSSFTEQQALELANGALIGLRRR